MQNSILTKIRKHLHGWGCLLGVLGLLGISSLVQAESIIEFKSGNTVKGRLIKEQGELYIFDISGTEISLKKSLIKAITEIEPEKIEKPKVIEKVEEVEPTGEPSITEKQASEEKQEKKISEHTGSIQGEILLPESEEKGNICIWFVSLTEKAANGVAKKYYQVIESKDIAEEKIAYHIKNVPDGEYKGFVNWDIAKPQWKKSWGAGNFLSLPGDYAGVTDANIAIVEGESLSDVNMDCRFFLKSVETVDDIVETEN